MMKSGYSLATSFYKIIQHLRSPSKDMAETSTPANRIGESFQLPRPNGRIDAKTTSPTKKGGASKRTNVESSVTRAKMTKPNITSHHHRNSHGEKLLDAKSIVCNGAAKGSQPIDRYGWLMNMLVLSHGERGGEIR